MNFREMFNFQNWNKKHWLFFGYFIFVIIMIVIIIGLQIRSKNLIVYGTKYNGPDNFYMIFYKDGTCERYRSTECTYDIVDNKDLYVYFVDDILKSNTELRYNILDKYNLKHYKTLIDEEELNPLFMKYGTIWSVNGYEIKEEDNNTESKKVVEEEKEPYFQKYVLFRTNGGKEASITFEKNNKCSVSSFTTFNNTNKSANKMYVTYTDGKCTYEKLENRQVIINYTGYVTLGASYYDSYTKSMKKAEIGSAYVLKGAIIEFSEDYSKFDYKNGKWEHITGEVYYYYYLKDEDKEKEKEKSSDNSDSSNKGNDYSEYKLPSTIIEEKKNDESNNQVDNNDDYEDNSSSNNDNSSSDNSNSNNVEESKPVVDTTNYLDGISFKSSQSNSTYNNYTWNIKLNDKNRAGNYYVTINGNRSSFKHNDTVYSEEFKKNGENCISINVEDKNGNKKDFNVCQNFEASKPKYSVSQVNGCSFNIFRGNSEENYQPYNSEKSLTCTLDGSPFDCKNTAVSVDKGTHTLRYANKYTYSDIKFSC